MSDRTKVLLLAAISSSVAIVGVVIVLISQYKAGFEVQRERLNEIVTERAMTIESVAAYDLKQKKRHFPEADAASFAFEATLGQFRDAHDKFAGFGETGEFTMAKRQNGQIVFVLRHRHDDRDTPKPVPFSSDLAEPMRRALSGRAGTVVAPDYRGVDVLAAYRPIDSLGLGLVAKIDLSEVRRPFFRAAASAVGAILVFIFAGTALILRLGNPIVAKLETQTAQLKREVADRQKAQDRISHLNAMLRAIRDVNQLIVRENDPISLIEKTCAIIVDARDCYGAWIAIGAENEPSSHLASSGWGNRPDAATIGLAPGGWPPCRLEALKTTDGYIRRTPLTDCTGCAIRALHGDNQTMVLPLRYEDKSYGLLGVFFPGRVPFDDDERALLTEVAGDIALALCNIESERRRIATEQALRDSENRYRLAQELSGIGAWEWNIVTDEIRWSDRIVSIWGYDRDSFKGTFDEVAGRVHPDDYQMWRESITACIEEGKAHEIEFRIQLPDDTIRWVAAFGDAVRDEDGAAVRMMGVVMDVTGRKRADVALKRSEELLTATGGMARVGGWEVDLTTNTVVWTRATKSIHEVPDDYVPTIDEAIDFFPESRDELTAALTRAREQGIPYDLQIPFRTAKGRRLWTRTIGRAEINDGKCARLYGTFQDITEQKQAEIELRALGRKLEERVLERTAELESANRELEAFAYSVSHDLRAPLRAIGGFSQIIAERHRDDLNEQGRHYFDNIVEASGKMEKLIDDLLRYARLGRRGVTLVPIDLNLAVQDVLETLNEEIRDAGARVVVSHALPIVRADQSLLSQVLSNLIGNAVKYRRTDVVPEIRIDWEERDGGAILTVSDNGLGIDHRFLEKIFGVFQRLHSDDAYPGTGIGLAVAAKAAGLMNGRIWVESAKDRGSVFYTALALGEKQGTGSYERGSDHPLG